MVNIFDFESYQKFLEAYLESLPRRGFGELAKIAKATDVHPSIVTLVVKGKKNFSVEQANDFCEYVGLSEIETEYFSLLVQIGRAGKQNLKKRLERKAAEIREKSKQVKERLVKRQELTPEKRALFYSQWYYSGVNLLTLLPGEHSAEHFAERLKIPRATAARVLQFLIENRLVIEKDGRFDSGENRIHLSAEDPMVQRHHANWRQKALEHLDRIREDELHFTGPLTISNKDIEVVRAMLLKAISEIFKVVDPSPSEELACLNIDWFRV